MPFKHFLLALIFTLVLVPVSCDIASSNALTIPEEPAQSAPAAQEEAPKTITWTRQPKILCLLQGEPIGLSCKAECAQQTVCYRWFETDADGQTKTPLGDGWSDSSDLQLDGFAEKGIRYFVCAATLSHPNGQDADKIPDDAVYSDLTAAAYTGLPIICIDTDEVETWAITRDVYVPSKFKMIMPNGTERSINLTKKGIKGRGASSWEFPKKSYNLNFDEKESFFELANSKKWCLISNYADKSLLRNKFASLLGNEIFNAGWNPSFYHVEFFLNKEFLGNYILCEKNTIGTGRIDIQDISDYTQKKILSEKYSDQDGDGDVDLYDGGFVLELDTAHDATFWFDTERGIPVTLKDPDEVTDEVWEHIKGLIQNAENVLYGDDFADYENGWRKFFDEDSLLDWYIVNELGKSVDASNLFVRSEYLYFNPITQKLNFGPNWDYDHCFGNADFSRDANTVSCSEPKDFYVKDLTWISRFFEDSLFVENLKSRWNSKKIRVENAINSIPTVSNEILVSAKMNFMIWKILGIHIHCEPEGFEERPTYQSNVDWLTNWLNVRCSWFDSAINGL